MLNAAIALLLVLGSPALTSTASPNAVVVWDLNAQAAIWDVARQQPNEQVRSFAIVNGAVYDAVNAIAGTPYEPYLIAPDADGTESMDAAVATAAHRVLADMFPAQQARLQAQYDLFLSAIADGPSKQGGIAVGATAAAAMIAARRGDGAFGDQVWTVGTEPGQWRPTPPFFGSSGAWTGYMRPFLLPSATRFRSSGPPPLTSAVYARDLDEVRRLGSAASTARTADQTEAAIWWHDRQATSWEIKRQLATSQRLDVVRTARLFALTDLVVADSGVACFRQKDLWSFWRPVTAIRLDDPTWTPLLVTPPFPEYPSGHACGTGARMAVYQFFFGRDDIAFSASSVDSGTTRHFSGFSRAIAELIDARVWGGVHFRTADVEGATLGEAVSRFATRHYLRPLRAQPTADRSVR